MNIFLFHRDLRLNDNTSLINQFKHICKGIITPIFIFPPQQILPKQNKYYSNNSVQFMIESLKDLNTQIQEYGKGSNIISQITYFMGATMEILDNIHQNIGIKTLGYNIDYTPYAKKRDKQINQWAKKNKIQIIANQDYLLYDILDGQTLSQKTGRPYLVFTPFKNFCMSNLKVRKPQNLDNLTFWKIGMDKIQFNQLNKINGYIQEGELKKFYEENINIRTHGGRSVSLAILDKISQFQDYNKSRNYPFIETTHLSAHLHFTTVSIREVYLKVLEKLDKDNNIINELHWRDFYANIGHYYPHVLGPKQQNNRSFKAKFDKLPWKYNNEHLQAWKNGTTGFPIVDAAMRQLNVTGFMHNRCRMIVASFFSKDLFLDWREGQAYFASKLVDYSPLQNSGGWQWCVGNGTDSQPYFRIFNPWTQQKNYDEKCIYIKKWIPQLEPVPIDDIHKWNQCYQKYLKKGVKYYKPIINHDEARKQTLNIYSVYLQEKKQQ